MTYSLKLDTFSGLCTILDGERVVAQEVGPRDAALIVEAMARMEQPLVVVNEENAKRGLLPDWCLKPPGEQP